MRIRWKLILSISIPLMLADGWIIQRDFARIRQTAEQQARGAVVERARMAAALIESKLSGVMWVAESTAEFLSTPTDRRNRQVRGLLGANLREAWVAATVVAFEPGVELEADQPPGVLATRSRRGPVMVAFEAEGERGYVNNEWYQWARQLNGPAWTASFEMPPLGAGKVYGYAAPIRSGDEFEGMVMVIVRAVDLQRLVGRAEPMPVPGAGDAVSAVPPAEREGTPLAPESAPTDPRPASDNAAQAEGVQPGGRDLSPPPGPRPDRPGGPIGATRYDEGRAAEAIEELGFGSYSIIDSRGQFVFSPDASLIQSGSVFDMARAAGTEEVVEAAVAALNGGSGVVRVEDFGARVPGLKSDEVYWIAFAPIPSTRWAFMTALEESSVMGQVMVWLGARAGFALLALAIPVLIVTLVAIRMSRPIEELAGAVDRLAGGELDVRVRGTSAGDEVGRLARGFNVMVLRLREHVETIRRETAAREKTDSEVRIARKIQTDLLPRTFPPFPDRAEFDLHAINEPARQIAGDFYDFFFTPDGMLTVVIADVSGKGIPAAMLMAVTRTIIRNQAMAGRGPGEIIRQTNDLLVADTSEGMFVTIFLARYDPATGRVGYANAGHPLPRVVGADGSVRPFGEGTAPLVGVMATAQLGGFDEAEGVLGVGESLVMYTDGVTEARPEGGPMLGDEGLDAWLREIGRQPVDRLCAELVRRVDEMQGGTPADDVTVVALRRNAV